MRARTGCKEASVFHQLHAAQIDLTVSPDRSLRRLPGLGERRRIQDDQVIPYSLLFQLREQFKYIRHTVFDHLVQAIQCGMLPRHRNRCFRSVDGKDMGSTGQGRIQSEGTRVGEAVENRDPAMGSHVFHQLSHCPAIVLLIQEESCLLPILHVHQIADPILGNRNECVERRANIALHALHSLQQTDLRVAALVDPTDHDPVLFQNLNQIQQDPFLQPVRAKRERFHHQYIREQIYGKSRQEVSFTEDQSAAGSVRPQYILAQPPRIPDSFSQKGRRDSLFRISGKQPYTNLRCCIEAAIAQHIAVKVQDLHDLPALGSTFLVIDLVVKDPGASCFQASCSALSDHDSPAAWQRPVRCRISISGFPAAFCQPFLNCHKLFLS